MITHHQVNSHTFIGNFLQDNLSITPFLPHPVFTLTLFTQLLL